MYRPARSAQNRPTRTRIVIVYEATQAQVAAMSTDDDERG